MPQIISQTEKASFQLFSVPLIFSVKIITLQIKGTLKHSGILSQRQNKGSATWITRLRQWSFPAKCVTVSFYTKRQSDIAANYSVDGDLLYCNNIQQLMEELQLKHTSGQWRLCADSSTVSLKTHENTEARQLLDNMGKVRRLQRKKPFLLV